MENYLLISVFKLSKSRARRLMSRSTFDFALYQMIFFINIFVNRCMCKRMHIRMMVVNSSSLNERDKEGIEEKISISNERLCAMCSSL